MNAHQMEQLASWMHSKRTESSLAKVAALFGVAKSTWQRYETGERQPPTDLLQKLVAEYKDAPAFLKASLPSEGAAIHMVQEPRAVYGAKQAAVDDFVDVPLYDINASMGGGAWVEKQQIKTYLKFRRDWLMWTTGTTRDLYLVTVRGDSMLPTITDGSVVLMRPHDTWNLSSGIYLVMLDSRICMKRLESPQLEAIEHGKTQLRATLVSDNVKDALPREVIFSDENSSTTTIIARAVWLGVKLP